MKLSFTFKHLDHSNSLEIYTQDQIDRIAGFLLKEGSGHIFYSKHKNIFQIEANIHCSGEKYFQAKSEHYDVYSAVDEIVAKLEKQFLKIRKINKHHKKVELSKLGKMNQLNGQFEPKLRHKKAA